MNASAAQPELHTLTIRRFVLIGIIGLLATAGVMAICCLFGQTKLTASILPLRLMRLSTAALVGVALASGGMSLQALLRNPLAEPWVLGLSSGAAVGVLLGMAMGSAIGGVLMGLLSGPTLAFIGAILTAGVVYLAAQRHGRLDAYSLILSGVIVNAFNGALMLCIYLYLDKYRIAEFTRWMIGEIRETTTPLHLELSAVGVLASWTLLTVRGGAFNALALGDDVAESSGISPTRIRIETFLAVSLSAGIAVSLAGPIAFLGLIVPHLCRLILPADFRLLTLAAGFGGAIFLMAAETLCYALPAVVNMPSAPVGVVTALLGGPTFLLLLRRKGGES